MSDADGGTEMLDRLASNAGGVAARQGFKYQDHVAAQFVLTMIADERLKQVECETADDIKLVWQDHGPAYPEYVQVKTTEEDSKWSQGEITKRAKIQGADVTCREVAPLRCRSGQPAFQDRL